MTIDDRVGSVKNQNILFLQGPMGKFFNKLFDKFTSQGANAIRIGFNFGDYFFAHGQNYHPYKGKPKDWKKYICNFLKSNKIDKIFLFGDCRFYHRIAIAVAKELGIEVFVFEEGYLRPGFITLEKNGVNAKSSLPRNREFYDKIELKEYKKESPFPSTYRTMAWWALEYFVVADLFYFLYPKYIHHRDFYAIKECFYGIRNCFRKYIYKVLEFGMKEKLETKFSGKYYFVIIQVHDDFQIREHSTYINMEDYIVDVLKSFARHAPKSKMIVFKHHPMDRGKKNYKSFIVSIARQLDIENRVIVLWDTHLPSVIDNCIAAITINSTVGLNTLAHKKPTICLGESFYNIDGITSTGMSLDDYWRDYKEVDHGLFLKFRQYMKETTQVRGSFYLSDKRKEISL